MILDRVHESLVPFFQVKVASAQPFSSQFFYSETFQVLHGRVVAIRLTALLEPHYSISSAGSCREITYTTFDCVLLYTKRMNYPFYLYWCSTIGCE
jgi:hypothetical protein